jgi:hypothetical protein
VGWFFVGIGAAMMIVAWTFSVCMMLAGRNLARRKNYWFCFIVACVACTFSPYGTVLGILTIVVLVRPSVKTQFGLAPPQAANAIAAGHP